MTKIEGPTEVPDNFYKLLNDAAEVLYEAVGHKGPYIILGWTKTGDLYMNTNITGGDREIAKALAKTAVKIADPGIESVIVPYKGTEQ